MWLNQLKIAIIQQDIDQLNGLLDDIPTFVDAGQMEEALYLFKEAKRIVEDLKDETAISMKQIKKNIDFLNSATADKPANFDITS
jgi:predicted translin family RNA/ssDNA-binding protein